MERFEGGTEDVFILCREEAEERRRQSAGFLRSRVRMMKSGMKKEMAQRRTPLTVKGLESMAYHERFKEISLFSSTKGSLRGDVMTIYTCLPGEQRFDNR